MPDLEADGDADDGPVAAHPGPGVVVASEPDDLPNQPLSAEDVPALLSKLIG